MLFVKSGDISGCMTFKKNMWWCLVVLDSAGLPHQRYQNGVQEDRSFCHGYREALMPLETTFAFRIHLSYPLLFLARKILFQKECQNQNACQNLYSKQMPVLRTIVVPYSMLFGNV